MSSENVSSVILGGDQRLSESIIWEIQRRFFLARGIDAWRQDIVPSHISSNPFLARAYGRVVLAYLRDCLAAWQQDPDAFPLDPAQPITIVELGSGSGRLAYHFLHHFLPQRAATAVAQLPIRFVMTDFVPDLLAFWQSHEKLQPWVKAGLLDFALFDVREIQPLSLVHSGEILAPGSTPNPIILLANYFFDSIPQDCFVIAEGRLSENLLSVGSRRPEPDFTDPTLWERLELAYEAVPVQLPYYGVPAFDEILQYYERELADTTFLFPNVGLACLQFWQEVGNGRLFLLTADKGHTLEEALLHQEDPFPALHGSFSLMVNYHAIGRYVAAQGGQVWHPAHYQNNLQVLACAFGPLPQNAREARLAFADAVEQGGPDDFFALKLAVEPHLPSFTLPQLLSYLRLSGWDAEIFSACWPILMEQIAQVPPAWYPDVYRLVTEIWNRYLPLGEDPDLAAQIGFLLYEIGYFSQAISFLETSRQRYGPQVDSLFYLALCHFALHHFAEAETLIARVLEQDPRHTDARLVRIKLKNR